MGYDTGKQVKGRYIHALVDGEGLPMRVVVHSAAVQDREGAGLTLDRIRRRLPWFEVIWADGGYNAWQGDAAVAKVRRPHLQIVKRSDVTKGIVVLPRRRVIERTFSWFGPASRQGFREPCRNPGRLRDPGLHPARPQAACSGVGRALYKNWVELMARFPRPGPSDRCQFGEETFAGGSGNGSNARIPAIRGTLAALQRPTR